MFLFILVPKNIAQEDDNGSFVMADEYESFKMVFGEIGYGARNLSLGAGFRWEFIGVDINIAGIISNTPRYIYPSKEFPYPKQYNEHSYPRTTVSFNASYFYDIEEFSIFGTVGYYSQTDTLLVRSMDDGNTFGYYYAKQGSPAEVSSGICFGIGGQYFIDEKFGAGLGYHTKKGFFLHFGYYWY